MKTSSIIGITAGTLLAAGVGYAVYFDHKRQTDATFRKKLRQDSKKTNRVARRQAAQDQERDNQAIIEVVRQLQQPGVIPAGPTEKEQFFMENVQIGETLVPLGPSQYLPAAIAFFKAIKVYPNPVELIMIYQKATPEPVFQLIMQMVGKDAELGGDAAGGDAAGPHGHGPGGHPLAGLSNNDEVDDEGPSSSNGPAAGVSSSSTADDSTTPAVPAESEAEASSGPPSQTSSQEWDTLSSTSLGPGASSSGQTNIEINDNTGSELSASSETTAGAGEETQDSGTPPAESDAKQSEEAAQQKAFDFSSGSYAPSPLFENGEVKSEEQQSEE